MPVAYQTLLGQGRMKEPYDWDAYAETFFPHAERLVDEASAAEAERDLENAQTLYL